MPELPEVEIVKRGMEGAALGRRIESVRLNRPDLRFPIPANLPDALAGGRLKTFMRRGKYILCFTDSGAGFVLHLGMSGVIKIIPAGDDYMPQKHDHVVFTLEDGGRLVFNDPRRFGFLDATHETRWQSQAPFDAMGPEPLSNDFSGPVLAAALKGRKASIKTALLDQKIVAGIGNIYACEALYIAGISPRRSAHTITGERAEKLALAVRSVLEKAIESGGSSLRDYYHTDGSLGYFQHSFSVYDRAGKPCPDQDCGKVNGKRIQRIVQGGRSTFFCSACQR